MRLRELPTYLVRALAVRCKDYDVVSGDNRITLKLLASACDGEIERRIEGGDFPETSATVKQFWDLWEKK
jgi:hypothetical protein